MSKNKVSIKKFYINIDMVKTTFVIVNKRDNYILHYSQLSLANLNIIHIVLL